MRSFLELAKWAIDHPALGKPDPKEGGAFFVNGPNGPLMVIASWQGGWDHVSVSHQSRPPTWSEMEFIKRRFFRDNETAMQLHVPPADHINRHPNCLHLWRPHKGEIPTPPPEFV